MQGWMARSRRMWLVVGFAGTAGLAGVTITCSKTNSPAQNGADAQAPCPDAAAPAADGAVVPDVPGSTDADSLSGLPAAQQITTTTVFKAPVPIEGLTADGAGNLYAPGRAGANVCPVWRVPAAGGTASIVGNLPAPCNPSGLTFNTAGDLFVADAPDRIMKLTPNDQTPPTATVFVSGVPGANGIAYDRAGNLWVSDGGTGLGRVWKVTADGTVAEMFRVQALSTDVNVVASPDGGVDAGVNTGGIGRDVRTLPPGTITVTAAARTAADTAGSQSVVANGIAFSPEGSLFIADTARGALWKATFDAQGALTSSVGCDATFSPNTLCLENLLLEHPLLEGVDGIAIDVAGNIWGAVNERNAVVVVTPSGHIREVLRNAADPTSRLRNGGPLEYPTSPIFVNKKLCLTQSDTNRRDNAPNSAGEVGPGVPGGPFLGKISCVDQPLPQAGIPLPVR